MGLDGRILASSEESPLLVFRFCVASFSLTDL